MISCGQYSYRILVCSLTFIISLTIIHWQDRYPFSRTSEKLNLKEHSNSVVEVQGLNQPRKIRIEKGAQRDQKNKIILLWTKYFGSSFSDDYYFFLEGNLTFIHYQCPISSCIATNKRSALKTADAVVFHQYDFVIFDSPQYRNPNQKWIFLNLEPPTIGKSWKYMNYLFNWTMSYRSDSDVVMKYGQVEALPASERRYHDKNYFCNKAKEIVWFVSNCHRSSNRFGYVKELSKYIEVDVYGRCGNKTCEPFQSAHCYETVLKDYKFYLSFENSICKDYVTEKLFNILNYDIIPVVMGGADYASISPPNSYIHTKNYPNPKRLAEFLKIVGSNETLYNSYFKWKGKYRSYLDPWMCKLCEKLHKNNSYSVLKNVSAWWKTTADCKTWENGRFVPVKHYWWKL